MGTTASNGRHVLLGDKDGETEGRVCGHHPGQRMGDWHRGKSGCGRDSRLLPWVPPSPVAWLVCGHVFLLEDPLVQ